MLFAFITDYSKKLFKRNVFTAFELGKPEFNFNLLYSDTFLLL